MSAYPCGCDPEAQHRCEWHARDGGGPSMVTAAVQEYLDFPTDAKQPRPCKHGHTGPRDQQRRCLECRRLWDRGRYARHRDKEKERKRRHMRRGLPAPTRACPGHCELCGGPSGKRTFHLDHDHKTGKFRGWLCGKCNTSLGKFGDDIPGLLRAVQYIQRNTNRSGLPTDAAKRKEYPLATGCLDYFPLALVEVAHVSFVGNQQHNPGQPLYWDRNKSTDEADAMLRHFKERGTYDGDGLRHSAKAAWRALAFLQKELEKDQKEGQ